MARRGGRMFPLVHQGDGHSVKPRPHMSWTRVLGPCVARMKTTRPRLMWTRVLGLHLAHARALVARAGMLGVRMMPTEASGLHLACVETPVSSPGYLQQKKSRMGQAGEQ
jgi:hypothetical protein